jgi:ubiquinone biosynthesis protein UbiJ
VPLILDRLQRSLNRQIDESTRARDLRAELTGSSLAVEIAGTGVEFVIRAEAGRVMLFRSTAEMPTAKLVAAPLDLLKHLRAGKLELPQDGVSGDREVAAKFLLLLKLARPDFEEQLSRWIGDLLAREMGRAAEDVRAWLERAVTALSKDTAEFLTEERRVLPGPLEARAFYGDVEKLRGDVERAAARLDELERRACAGSGSF